MNVHHLELFYYVAKFEGITAAVRKMPYGIQQPAVSGQILLLEKNLGVKLFNRRPFALTAEGEDLYGYIYPFFSKLGDIGERLRGQDRQHLRLAASAATLTYHLPEILDRLRKEFPKLRLTLKDSPPSDVETLLANQEIDVAISVLHGKQNPGVKSLKLIELPLVLLVPDRVKARSLDKLIVQDIGGKSVGQPLVSLPGNEAICQIFQKGLEKRDISWLTKVEVNTLDLVESYVRNGFGIGLSVEIPGARLEKGVRILRLRGFSPLRVGLLYMGKLKPLAARFVEQTVLRAKYLVKAGV